MMMVVLVIEMVEFICGKVDAPLVKVIVVMDFNENFLRKIVNIYLIMPSTAKLVEIIQCEVEFSQSGSNLTIFLI